MILLNGDLPLEIQPLKSKSQVVSRPVQDLSCKWHVCIHTIPFHFPPCIPHLPLLLEQASKEQERVTRSAPGDPVRLTIHKVHEVEQPRADGAAPWLSPPQQPWGLYGATAHLLADTCAPPPATLSPLLLLTSAVGRQHVQDDSQKPKL